MSVLKTTQEKAIAALSNAIEYKNWPAVHSLCEAITTLYGAPSWAEEEEKGVVTLCPGCQKECGQCDIDAASEQPAPTSFQAGTPTSFQAGTRVRITASVHPGAVVSPGDLGTLIPVDSECEGYGPLGNWAIYMDQPCRYTPHGEASHLFYPDYGEFESISVPYCPWED